MATNEQRIWQAVSLIPSGMVATYGQIADLAGLPGRARLVGRVMSRLPADTRLPWHRVINSRGSLSFPPTDPRYTTQRQRLEAEGIRFDKQRISLPRHQWRV